VIDTDAAIGAGVVITGSVVMPEARIGAGSVVESSVVGAGATVGAGCRIVDAVIGDGARIGDRNELIAGTRVWPAVELPAVAVRFSTDA
jgi:mannose-1-phosphate guanylyltransferase